MEVDVKKLFDEVVRLRDELAKMQRKYDDLLYNLDDDNFSGEFLKEKNGMKTQIELAAEGIKTAVSKTDLKTTLKSYSTVEQTAKKITTAVSEINADMEETKASIIEQTAGSISSEVRKTINLSVATVVESEAERTDASKIYAVSDGKGGYTYYYYNSISEDWEQVNNDTIYSFFEQTIDGFQLKGNVLIKGNLVKSSDEQGNVIEINKGFLNIIPNSGEIPKLQMGFTESDNYENPYILIGAGDGRFDKVIAGIPFKSSSGLIYKNTNGMLISYLTSENKPLGIGFLEDGVVKFYGDLNFEGCGTTGLTATAVFG